MEADPTIVVPALLAAAGLTPRPDELAVMIADFPARAEEIAKLYAVPEARYEEPALIFHAEL
ncbi:hypothetical protein [Amycolatopsis sp. GM8]|uniref:hypothetical protein n=1 Tax=Amycolatopsis sp. GM8 TaxID=2896530 RepID=UPI001F253D89|nr:hypothetical protein [Amycolatopsis sp. GM8]